MGRTPTRMLLSLLVLLAPGAEACLWDADTLRHEMKGLPGVTEAIVGAFERLPDAFYEERLLIADERLATGDAHLGTYDDAAVACDRLGRHAVALDWLAKKRAALDELPEFYLEHEYRYHANLGTVLAHRWLSGGADRDDMADLRAARDEIARAIEINPDAHFGREVVQLAVLDWLLAPADVLAEVMSKPQYDVRIPAVSQDRRPSLAPFLISRAGRERTLAGLVGMISMGAAWESVDVMAALQELTRRRGDNSVAYIAHLRVLELLEQGRMPLRLDVWEVDEPDDPVVAFRAATEASTWTVPHLEKVDWEFRRWRSEADAYHQDLEEWAEAKLTRGIHPDRIDDPSARAAFWATAPQPSGMANHGSWGPRLGLGLVLVIVLIAVGLTGIVAFVIGQLAGRAFERQSTSSSRTIRA
ncbi:MAG: hypothetical protein AAGG07_09115 [Planctomycetota bacterium]